MFNVAQTLPKSCLYVCMYRPDSSPPARPRRPWLHRQNSTGHWRRCGEVRNVRCTYIQTQHQYILFVLLRTAIEEKPETYMYPGGVMPAPSVPASPYRQQAVILASNRPCCVYSIGICTVVQRLHGHAWSSRPTLLSLSVSLGRWRKYHVCK